MQPATRKPLVIGSRASKLAQIQTEIVHKALQAAHPDQSFEIRLMTTEGDRNQSQALYLLGGKALWTKDLEVRLLDGSIDMIVHSLKDVPTSFPEGCELGAIMEREEPRDSLVVKKNLEFKTLEEMPKGSVIGTSSVRRVALLRRALPHLEFRDVRGNLFVETFLPEDAINALSFRNTRLAKLDADDGPYTALILAAAGLERLGFADRITSLISPPTLYPAVGQAALGVEIRSNDLKVAQIASVLTHWQTQWSCLAERACLRLLEGGCSVPVGVFTTIVPVEGEEASKRSATLKMMGTVTSLDGAIHVEATVEELIDGIEAAEALGRKLGDDLIANGADAVLEDIKKDRYEKQVKQNIPVASETS